MNDKDNDWLDNLLSDNPVTPPDHFADSVMSKLSSEPVINQTLPAATPAHQSIWPPLALAASSVLGMIQIVGYIFGLWIPATAG
ncbi:MAG: hypothetical protein AAF404_00500 [Pseudomonadota bacterium]